MGENMNKKDIPRINSNLRKHILMMPETIWSASGIVIWGKRIKSLVFSTDIAIIRNCNADAVLAVYPFTPQQTISDAVITSSYIPVFCGIGGGTTTGPRVSMLAMDAEAQGAMGVVVNAPTTNEDIRRVHEVIDIPIVVTVLRADIDLDARLEAGVSILNISAAERTPEVVDNIRKRYPLIPIIATGGITEESVKRTIDAGANAISYTPPSTKELFKHMMNDYRERGF